MENTFKKLASLQTKVPKLPKLPSVSDIEEKEVKYGINLPPSYKEYLKNYSNLSVGFYEPYQINRPEAKHIDFDENVNEAWQYGLSKNYLPFLTDNGDYFCFDLTSKGPEFQVVFISHEMEEERWDNFLQWTENCWIKGTIEDQEEFDDEEF